MIIQHIGNRALSMYIPASELDALGLCPDAIGPREAETLLAGALKEKALGNWEAAEMEVYPGKDSILLFARRKSSRPCHFLFSDFEDLVTAAALCPDPLPSSLHTHEGGYILTVYPFEGDEPPAVLWEYGERQAISPHLPEHLTEQGMALLRGSALSLLREHFTSDLSPAPGGPHLQ